MHTRQIRRTIRTSDWCKQLLACVMLLAPTLATAQALTAESISEAVSNRTYQGSMTADAFAEFYAEDGTIKGDGYTGKWRAEEDTMCFQYGENSEECWGVIINGPSMTLLKDGKVDGSGMLIDGNPLDF